MVEKPEADHDFYERQRILEMRCGTWPKILNFYCGSIHQKLKVYRNTPKNQVLLLITKIFKRGLTEAESIRASLGLMLLDEEGTPVVFNVEAVPSEIKLYLHFEEAGEATGGLGPGKSISKEERWLWNEALNESHCGYKIINGQEVFNDKENVLKGGMPVLLSKTKFKPETGVFRFKVLVEGPGLLYTQVGIVYESEAQNLENLGNFGENMKPLASFQKFAVVGESESDFVVDTINRELKIGKLVWKGLSEACFVGVAIRRGFEARIQVITD